MGVLLSAADIRLVSSPEKITVPIMDINHDIRLHDMGGYMMRQVVSSIHELRYQLKTIQRY